MHRRRTVEKDDCHDEERKKHHYERVIDICKTFVDTIVFEHELVKSHLRSIFNENRVAGNPVHLYAVPATNLLSSYRRVKQLNSSKHD